MSLSSGACIYSAVSRFCCLREKAALLACLLGSSSLQPLLCPVPAHMSHLHSLSPTTTIGGRWRAIRRKGTRHAISGPWATCASSLATHCRRGLRATASRQAWLTASLVCSPSPQSLCLGDRPCRSHWLFFSLAGGFRPLKTSVRCPAFPCSCLARLRRFTLGPVGLGRSKTSMRCPHLFAFARISWFVGPEFRTIVENDCAPRVPRSRSPRSESMETISKTY